MQSTTTQNFFFTNFERSLKSLFVLRLRGHIYQSETSQFHKDYCTQQKISVSNDVWFPFTKFSHLLKMNYRNSALVARNWDKNCYQHLVLELPSLFSVDTNILPKCRKPSCQTCGHHHHKYPGAVRHQHTQQEQYENRYFSKSNFIPTKCTRNKRK